jgi:hypothetical protein
VVIQAHRGAIELSELSLSVSQSLLASNRLTLQHDQTQAAAATSAAAAARDQLSSAQAALLAARASDQKAQARLAQDRERLRGLALGLYTGAMTGPQATSMQTLAYDQQAAIDQGEAEVVALLTVRSFHADLASAAAADRLDRRAMQTVTSAQQNVTTATNQAEAAAARLPVDASLLAGAERQVASAQREVAQARAELRTALTALDGPSVGLLADGPPASSPAGISLLGGSALNADQLAGWFNEQGYVDLTTTTVKQLASWYLQVGAAEGVRGDVAFAQAVLETGGFSSPDAVGLNNYAGIGHCDTCPAGWPFPSPHAGVTGQLQLLRIFADPGAAPRGAPAPVLPALVPARQGRRGCCATWESLTGVWATDPTYGVQILTLYQGMLAFAAASESQGPSSTG